jgi:hypothetical protein
MGVVRSQTRGELAAGALAGPGYVPGTRGIDLMYGKPPPVRLEPIDRSPGNRLPFWPEASVKFVAHSLLIGVGIMVLAVMVWLWTRTADGQITPVVNAQPGGR